MRTGQVAKEAGVNIQTLRYYERRGLLSEPARSESGYRVYRPDAVETVRFIKQAQELGFSLREAQLVRQLLASGPEDFTTVLEFAKQKVAELDRKLANLRAMRDTLAQRVDGCARREPPTRLARTGEGSLVPRADRRRAVTASVHV